MTQKIINIGTADKGNGDPIRTAFGKVNDNFTELYAALGLDSGGLNLGAFEFTDSTITTTDSSPITINQQVNITSDLIVGGDLLPTINSDGITGFTLGSPTLQWKELFVSNGSIYLGNVKLSNVNGKLAVTKVINPGEDDEADDPEDSEADSEIKYVNKLVNEDHVFTLTSDGTLTLDGDPFTGGGGNANLYDIRIEDSNIGSDSSQNFVNLDVDGDGWMRLGTFGNEKLQIIVDYSDDEHIWEFGIDGSLKLPVGGDIVDSNGDSVLGGGSNSYTPDDSDNWDSPTVNTVAAALDELAAKVAALENFEIDGGNAYTPAAGELTIDGNGA